MNAERLCERLRPLLAGLLNEAGAPVSFSVDCEVWCHIGDSLEVEWRLTVCRPYSFVLRNVDADGLYTMAEACMKIARNISDNSPSADKSASADLKVQSA